MKYNFRNGTRIDYNEKKKSHIMRGQVGMYTRDSRRYYNEYEVIV